MCITSIVWCFSGSTDKVLPQEGDSGFDLLEVFPWKCNTDLQDEQGSFIAGVEDDWFEMTFNISLS